MKKTYAKAPALARATGLSSYYFRNLAKNGHVRAVRAGEGKHAAFALYLPDVEKVLGYEIQWD